MVEENRVEKKTGLKKKQGGKKNRWKKIDMKWHSFSLYGRGRETQTENTEQCKTPTRAMYPSPHAPTTAASIPRFYVRVVLCRGRALGAFFYWIKSTNMSISLNQL